MKVFRRIEDYDLKESHEPIALSIGNFDGVHRGHQEIIRTLKQKSKKGKEKLRAGVLTFDPHPKKVLYNPDFRALQDIEEKCMVFSLLKIDLLISHPFTVEFSKLTPKDFIVKMLKQRLNVSHLVVGSDFSCGGQKSGQVDNIKGILAENGINLTVVPVLTHEKNEVHSNLIRQLIQNGRIAEANKYLFSPYSLNGKVIYGKRRGTDLGFPTINFYNDVKVIPAKGVYCTQVLLDG